jgi:predicted transcriptional regulator
MRMSDKADTTRSASSGQGRGASAASGRDTRWATSRDSGPAADPAAGNPDGVKPDATALSRFAEDYTFALVQMGFPRMPARVLVALSVTDAGRLTAAELANSLQASPAAVSGAVRYLIHVGLIRREGEPGSRRHYYRVPDDSWEEVLRLRDGLMTRWASLVREGAGIVGAGTPAGRRLAETAEFLEFVSVELPDVIRRWQQHKAALDGQTAPPASA